MINIIKEVILQMQRDGLPVTASYGDKWLHAFNGVSTGTLVFFFDPQKYNFNVNNKEELHTVRWVAAYETIQNSADEVFNINLENDIKELNIKFILRLFSYMNTTTSSKLITDIQNVECSAFHDLKLFETPASGFLCSLNATLLLTDVC